MVLVPLANAALSKACVERVRPFATSTLRPNTLRSLVRLPVVKTPSVDLALVNAMSVSVARNLDSVVLDRNSVTPIPYCRSRAAFFLWPVELILNVDLALAFVWTVIAALNLDSVELVQIFAMPTPCSVTRPSFCLRPVVNRRNAVLELVAALLGNAAPNGASAVPAQNFAMRIP
jgi:hypothetical protein